MTDEKRGDEEELTVEDHMRNYFKAFVEIDRAMEPFKEHKKALKQNYVDNKWLTREQMSLILRAYRDNENELDFKDYEDAFNLVKRTLKKQ